MAKRFTDTDKWKKAWFRRLEPRLKCAWLFLCDNCDHAGVWSIDLDALEFHVGAPITEAELEEVFKVRRVDGDKFFIESFIDFQYGELRPENRVHFSVIQRLEKLGAFKDHPRTLLGPKDIDKEQDKDKDKEKDRSKTFESDAARMEAGLRFDLQRLFSLYPRHQKKSTSIAFLAQTIHDLETYAEWERAIQNYAEHCRREELEQRFILTFPKFIDEWRDWLDWSPAQTNPKRAIRFAVPD